MAEQEQTADQLLEHGGFAGVEHGGVEVALFSQFQMLYEWYLPIFLRLLQYNYVFLPYLQLLYLVNYIMDK